tara:strand:- start:3599 stop:4462 length:864 start_codon:yes stop_codon:yes gene_type:complete
MDFKKTFDGVKHQISIDPSGIDICGNGHININMHKSQIDVKCKEILIDASTNLVGNFDASYSNVYIDVSNNIKDGNNIGGIIPLHGVIMWSGLVADIPNGWVLCDGSRVLSNGVELDTPNMNGQFIIGTNNIENIGDISGAHEMALTEEQLPTHTHEYDVETQAANASHKHNTSTSVSVSEYNANHNMYKHHHLHDNTQSQTLKLMSWAAYNHPNHPRGFRWLHKTRSTSNSNMTHEHNFNSNNVNTANRSDHTHNIANSKKTGVTGNNEPIKNQPTYYVLAYIMKI